LLSAPGSPRSLADWLDVWGTLVLMGFRYPLALTVRVVLAGASIIAFASGHAIVGAIALAAFVVYLLQVPLIVGIARDKWAS
jgi:hypothetical protein